MNIKKKFLMVYVDLVFTERNHFINLERYEKSILLFVLKYLFSNIKRTFTNLKNIAFFYSFYIFIVRFNYQSLNMNNNILSAHLRDKSLEALFNKFGFVKIKKFLNREKIDALKKIYQNYLTEISSENILWNSLFDLGYNKGMEASTAIKEIIEDAFDTYFEDFDLPMATFMSKNPRKNTTCELHRDFSVFDERICQFRNFWIPLVDINKTNGALYVIPYSHKLFTDMRPMFIEWPYKKLETELLNYKKDIYVNAGDLVLYADKTLHGSSDNLSSYTRPVVHGGVLPENSQIFYFRHLPSQKKIEKYQVQYDFFMKNIYDNEEELKHYAKTEVFEFTPRNIDLKEIRQYFNEAHLSA